MINLLALFEKLGTEKRVAIHAVARMSIGKDMGDSGYGDALDCAITLNNVVQLATGKPVGGGASTHLMYKALLWNPLWRQVPIWKAEAGDVIISPTGYRRENSLINNGHCGIISATPGHPKVVMSNNSNNGLWEEVYKLDTWYDRYSIQGKYPVVIFRRIL